MRRATTVPTRNPSCVPLLQQYCGADKIQAYKERFHNHNDLGNYISSQAAADLSNRTPAANERINRYLSQLQIFEQRMETIMQCVQQDILQRQEISSKIYTKQKDLENKRKELDEKEQIAKDAKERARLLKDPYAKISVWETWFPLGRPLRQESVPVLLSLSIFFLTLSLGMFLRLGGIELGLRIPFLEGEGFTVPKYRFSVERV